MAGLNGLVGAEHERLHIVVVGMVMRVVALFARPVVVVIMVVIVMVVLVGV